MIKEKVEKCQFRKNVGDINEDGNDEFLCIAKSQYDEWPDYLVLPSGHLVFCDNCYISGEE